MRKICLFLLVILAVSLSCKMDKPYTLNQPESIIWNPATHTYLISNIGSGQILSLKNKNEFLLFSQSKLKGPKGMALQGNTIYVADVDRLVGLDAKSGRITFELPIPGATFLNDTAAAPDSFVFVSDTNKDWILIVNPKAHTFETFTNPELSKPNGLYFSREASGDKVYVCSLRDKAPLQVLDLKTREFSSIPHTEVSRADGFTREPDGSWLVSSWQDSTVYKFSPDFKSRSRLKADYTSPADIYYSSDNNELAIPQLQMNMVQFIPSPDFKSAPDK